MKIFNILSIAIIGGCLLSGCDSSFLDEERNPNKYTPNQFWKSKEDIMKGLTGAYGALHASGEWAASYERYIVIDNYRSDETRFRPDVGSWDNIASFVNDQSNSTTRTEWKQLYRGINVANQCIDNIPNVQGNDDAIMKLKECALSEARFLRAYYYFRLYINFGEHIPLYTHQIEQNENDFFPQQAKDGEIVNFIKTELSEIQETLPEKYDQTGSGRATCYAAAAILGKLYMFNHEIAKAEKEFEKIIGRFKLVDNYEDNFDGLHKNNSESIFEVQYSGDRSGGRREYNNIAEHLSSGSIGGYEEAFPSDWLFDLLKKDKTIDGKYSSRLYGTILFDDPGTKMWYIGEGQQFKDIEKDNSNKIFWKKFATWDKSLSSDWWASAFNIPIIRYADILLLYAECLNDRGKTTEAVHYINEVRQRVNVPKLEDSMSKDEILKHLQNVERPCELAFEGVRWYDLLRWGIEQRAIKEHNKKFAENYIPTKHKLFPIPRQEFEMNPDWKQNPNFGK